MADHIGNLKPDPTNARRHTPRNLGQIERSIQANGFGRSVLLANDGTIIAGNATIDAAASAGLEDVIVVETDGTKVVAVKRTDVEPGSPAFHRLAVSDNRAAELAEWDADVLRHLAEADQIDLDEYFLEDEKRTLDLLASLAEPLTDPDDVPAVPDEPVTKPGDLWLLGRHRLMCGDATVVTDVERLMAGERADMVFTDPPYGLGKSIANDELSEHALRKWNQDWLPLTLLFTADNAHFVCFHSTRLFNTVLRYAEDCGWAFERYLTLYKPNDMTFPWHGWILKSESVLLFTKGRPQYVKIDPYLHDTLVYNNSSNFTEDVGGHPTVKLIGMTTDLVERFRADLVLDLFGGSGSTLIACEQTGRRCAMLEIDPHYCDVIVNRWQNFTGQTATLDHRHAQAAD